MLATLHALVDGHYAGLPCEDAAAAEARAHHAGRNDALQSAAAIGIAGDAADLELLVRDALRPFQFGETPGIAIAGPGVLIRPAAAQLLTLVLHELTTNAIKFGALGYAVPRQTLQVGWKYTARGVVVEWRERGVAILGPAERPRMGFGRQLIEHVVAAYCGTQPSFRLLPGGVECTMTMPAQAVVY
nr:hypothetical protein [uncultured Sphingomonas sp.]